MGDNAFVAIAWWCTPRLAIAAGVNKAAVAAKKVMTNISMRMID